MKKILITDYDDTLRPVLRDNLGNIVSNDNYGGITDYSTFETNLNSINYFRNFGNIFAISTGRPLESIKEELIEHNIKFDYLGCNDGSVLFDGNYNLLEEHLFDEYVRKEIVNILKFTDLSFFETFTTNGNIIQYHLDVTNLENKNYIIEKFHEVFEPMKQELSAECLDFGFSLWLMIRPKGITKSSSGYDILKRHPEICKSNIITVGDNNNDLPMIKEFDGYIMSHSYPNVKLYSQKEIESVSQLVRKYTK